MKGALQRVLTRRLSSLSSHHCFGVISPSHYKDTTMERPVKRQRITLGPTGTDDEDELDCEPNELNQRRDPVYQLEQARARASNKLKSRFEDIFAKYEKDFTGVGDEIDLRTGEVVVNNGHLQSITGVQEFGEGDEDEDEDAHFSGNARPVRGLGAGAMGNGSSEAMVQRNPWEVTVSDLGSPLPAAGVGGPPGLSSMMPPAHDVFMPPREPFGSWENGHTQVVDPAWQAPELPRTAFMSPRFGAQAQQHIFGMGQTTKVTRRSLLEPRNQDADEEDVLLSVPDSVLGKKESPLIKSKFPAVGSSPNNDSGLQEMIQDVIQNIADSSPSAEQSRKGASGTRPPTKSRIRPVRADADINCNRRKKQTSENRRSSTGKAKAVSSSRVGEKNPPNDEGRRRQSAVTSPAQVATTHEVKQARTHHEHQTAHSTGEPDPPCVNEDFYLDVTGNTPVKPAGQTFYVEIKARKVGQTDRFARDEEHDEFEAVDRGFQDIYMSDQTLQPPPYRPFNSGEKATDPPNKNRAMEPSTKCLTPETRNPGIVDGPSQRKRSDPVFALADAGDLLPAEQKPMSAPAGINDQATQDSRPTVPQKQAKEQFERNIVDPSYAFSDEENLLPRRKRNNRRDSEPASRASLAAQYSSRVGEKAKAEKLPHTIVALDASSQEKRDRAALASSQPIVEREAVGDVKDVSKPSQEQKPEEMASVDLPAVPPSRPHQKTRRNRPEEPVAEQAKKQATQKSRPQSLRGRPRNKTGNDLHGPSDFRHRSPPVFASNPTTAEERPPSPKPAETAEAAPVPPSTPQSKSNARSEKTELSRSGLISLLSDDEDEEDEISFNLADFTPSGHHRILALRPHHQHPGTASSGKQRRVASLLFGPASTSKISKHSTPGSDDKKSRRRRRRSTNTLAGSVVKVRRDSPRVSSPAASVVQTPGGTKRRCGQDGFRCERDFCFICISI